MPAREVFEMATIAGAGALGIERDVGSLEVGKKADFAAIDLLVPSVAVEPSEKDPSTVYSALVYAASPQCVRETWVDGRSVYKSGSYPGSTTRGIVEEALRERRKLFARVQR